MIARWLWRRFSERTKAELLQEYVDMRFSMTPGRRWLTIIPHIPLAVTSVSDKFTYDEVSPGVMLTINVLGAKEVKLAVRPGRNDVRAA